MRKVILILTLCLFIQILWTANATAAPPASGGFWHTVRYGESLSSIGRWYGVNPYAICRANGLYNCNYIWAGQRLWIPAHTPHPPRQCAAYHYVYRGQTLYQIAGMYGVHPWAIARANNIYNLNRIYAGQTLCIPYY